MGSADVAIVEITEDIGDKTAAAIREMRGTWMPAELPRTRWDHSYVCNFPFHGERRAKKGRVPKDMGQ